MMSMTTRPPTSWSRQARSIPCGNTAARVISNIAGALVFLVAVGGCQPSRAVTPLTPHLARTTHQDLLSKLSRAGMPETAQNSVVISITSVLGLTLSDRTFAYREPFPQLPEVDATATRRSERCASVVAVARMSEPKLKINVLGTYCMVAPGEWTSNFQSVAPAF